ncbi:MAG TPA: hypothetical protein VHO23_00055 [Candidatus Paceibacterota bacterium]|nr:hypothetical protein [Candidatus Paceibacterota bacterium]
MLNESKLDKKPAEGKRSLLGDCMILLGAAALIYVAAMVWVSVYGPRTASLMSHVNEKVTYTSYPNSRF